MITINANQIMIEQYDEVLHVSADAIRVRTKLQEIEIKGMELHILALSKYEVLIEGKLEGMIFHARK